MHTQEGLCCHQALSFRSSLAGRKKRVDPKRHAKLPLEREEASSSADVTLINGLPAQLPASLQAS
jgi:hypothetical protein